MLRLINKKDNNFIQRAAPTNEEILLLDGEKDSLSKYGKQKWRKHMIIYVHRKL